MDDYGLKITPEKSEMIKYSKEWAFFNPKAEIGGHVVLLNHLVKYL